MALPKAATMPDGTRYKVHYDRDWQEWQVRAYVKNKFNHGRTIYCSDREDALNTFDHITTRGIHKNPVRIKAQGHDVGPSFDTKTQAIKQIRAFVKEDARDCRRKFGTAIVEKWKNDMWEVRPLKDRRGPLWSRYTIHES